LVEKQEIYISVTDINDNGPQIVNTGKTYTITAGSAAGVNIAESGKFLKL
jgi:hypothetical protein